MDYANSHLLNNIQLDELSHKMKLDTMEVDNGILTLSLTPSSHFNFLSHAKIFTPSVILLTAPATSEMNGISHLSNFNLL